MVGNRGAKSVLTGGRPSFGPSAASCLTTSPPESTGAGVNRESDVGRELGGVGTYTGTGFRQPIPRDELEGAIAVISRLILSQLGRWETRTSAGYKERRGSVQVRVEKGKCGNGTQSDSPSLGGVAGKNRSQRVVYGSHTRGHSQGEARQTDLNE